MGLFVWVGYLLDAPGTGIDYASDNYEEPAVAEVPANAKGGASVSTRQSQVRKKKR